MVVCPWQPTKEMEGNALGRRWAHEFCTVVEYRRENHSSRQGVNHSLLLCTASSVLSPVLAGILKLIYEIVTFPFQNQFGVKLT
jgi:hypothetical protein